MTYSLGTATPSSARAGESGARPANDKAGYAISDTVATVAQPASMAAEAIRALRTQLMAQHIEKGRRALAICGASVGVGCTLLSVDLAVALSQIGLSTLLIDANLRQPGVESLIRPPVAVPGLRQYLMSQDADLDAAIKTNVLPNLSVMYAGGAAPNAQELLGGERFRALMDFCLRDFDITIIDTPPANRCSDAARVSSVVGYALVVARRDVSFIEDVKTLVGQLQATDARVVGTVLNEV